MDPEGSIPHSQVPATSLSWASSIQSIPLHPTSWRSILILSSHLRLGLPSGSFPQVSPPKPCIYLSPIRTQEKLTGPHLVKKFPAFYGIPRFITAFTSALHLSLLWASSIQSMSPHSTSWRPILTPFSHQRPGLPSGLFPSGFPTKTLYAILLFPHVLHAPPISFFFDHPNNIWRGVQVIKLLIM